MPSLIAPKIENLAPATRRRVADAFYQLRDAGVHIKYVPLLEGTHPSVDAVLTRWQDDFHEVNLHIAADLPRSVALNVMEQAWTILLAPELCRWIEREHAEDGWFWQTFFARSDGGNSEDRRRG